MEQKVISKISYQEEIREETVLKMTRAHRVQANFITKLLNLEAYFLMNNCISKVKTEFF